MFHKASLGEVTTFELELVKWLESELRVLWLIIVADCTMGWLSMQYKANGLDSWGGSPIYDLKRETWILDEFSKLEGRFTLLATYAIRCIIWCKIPFWKVLILSLCQGSLYKVRF